MLVTIRAYFLSSIIRSSYFDSLSTALSPLKYSLKYVYITLTKASSTRPS